MEEGFTLVEVLLTIALLSLVFLAVSNFFLNSYSALFYSRRVSVANNLTQLKIEELGLREYKSINSKLISKVDGELDYSYKIIVREIKKGVKEVKVRVYWKGDLKAQLLTFYGKGSNW